MFEKDGVTYVVGQKGATSPKGLSYVLPSENLAEKLHGSFKGQCFVKQPSVSVSTRFEMIFTHEFSRVLLTPEQRRTIPRPDWPAPEVCGKHYRLSPLVNMPLADVQAEVRRITDVQCGYKAGGEASSWPPKMPWPSEMAMTCIAKSLQWLYQQEDEDTDIRVLAALEYVHACSVDMAWEDLLADQGRAEFALYAMERHCPSFSDDDDGGFESDFFATAKRLREAVETGKAAMLAEIRRFTTQGAQNFTAPDTQARAETAQDTETQLAD